MYTHPFFHIKNILKQTLVWIKIVKPKKWMQEYNHSKGEFNQRKWEYH